ncbi:MAG: type VI secretion system accessory protein TagJ [Planctomycetota bacterium]|jgi:type VI secretion system protein ImpE
MSAKEHYQAGRLDDAVAAAAEEVKRHPTDVDRRGFLAELLCFTGELERADKHLDAMGHQNPEAIPGISMFRQLIRAEQARQQFFDEGRMPEFLDKPDERLRLHLEASIRIREGNDGEAAEFLGQAEQKRPKVSGTAGDEPFDDLRDLDDLTASYFEVLTSTGKYYWIPMERVETMECHAPVRPRDLLWRRVHMVVCGGPDGEVFLPALYAGSHTESDDQMRLGRATDWSGGDGTPARGRGQRTFLLGDQDHGILTLGNLTFANPMAAPDDDQIDNEPNPA